MNQSERADKLEKTDEKKHLKYLKPAMEFCLLIMLFSFNGFTFFSNFTCNHYVKQDSLFVVPLRFLFIFNFFFLLLHSFLQFVNWKVVDVAQSERAHIHISSFDLSFSDFHASSRSSPLHILAFHTWVMKSQGKNRSVFN